MHERLLEALLKIADARLVASFQNDELGFPSEKDMRIFIPDMHLTSRTRGLAYRYGTNHEDLLLEVVSALTTLKTGAADDETIEVYHIGDYLDLWRESLGPAGPEIPDLIKRDHADLVDALESRPLRAHFLLGNHDFDLWQWHPYAAWDRRYYLPGAGNAPAVMVMHGDYFDWVERLPALVKDIAVYVFAPNRAPDNDILGEMQKLSHQFNAERDYASHLQLRLPTIVGAMPSAETAVLPEWNIQRPAADGQPATVSDPASLTFLDSASKECQKANLEFGLEMKVVIIGHTHRARIAVRKNEDGSLFTLIDCGAWIENCRQTEEDDPAPNAQIAVLSGNWARIYQLAPL